VEKHRKWQCALLAGLSVLFLFVACSKDEQTLKPFASDGCSAFPDGTFDDQQLWLQCCVAHDFQYWQGGSYEQRRQSDLQLQQCVTDIGQPKTAELMLAGVRVGGSPYWPTKFRWAYGWPYGRGYDVLSEAELEMVSASIEELILDSSEIHIDK